MFSLVWIFTELLMKDDTQKGAFIQGSCRSSAAILGMAFVQNMYSDTGMAPLMIVAAVPLFNIFAVVVLTFKAHPEKVLKEEVNVKDVYKRQIWYRSSNYSIFYYRACNHTVVSVINKVIHNQQTEWLNNNT